jgi:hypothetical protein
MTSAPVAPAEMAAVPRVAPFTRALRVALVALVALPGCPSPLPPPPKPVAVKPAGAPRRELGPLVAVGFGADRVGHDNATLAGDGDPDFELRVRVSGDVKALVLHSSDTAGNPVGGEIWDTLPKGPMPPAWRLPVPETWWTWALGVYDAQGKLLNPEVTLPATTFDDATLTLVVGDTGRVRFVAGRTYTLIVQRTDGTVERTTTTIL